MMTAVSIFSCTNDYDPGLIENLGMKEQPLRIITKVLTTKSPNFIKRPLIVCWGRMILK